jgi:tetratricopeptide (TPR) repeat protein
MIFRSHRFRERAREFAETGRRLQQERATAPGIVDPLLQNTPRMNWSTLSELRELQTAGALECLGNRFAESLPKDANYAKAIADLAVATAEALPQHSYPAIVIGQLRAHAWKDLGIAYRTVGKLDESLEAFDTATGCISAYAALAHDRAIINLARALTLQELERFEEARTLLTETTQVFIDHGDVKRHVLATFVAGVLLQRMKHHREARGVYQRLLDAKPPGVDTSVIAALHRAIGFASMDLGDFADAESHLVQSIKLNQQLSQHVEATRGQYAFGRLLIRRGDSERAVTYLRPVRRQFLENGLTEEAGLCGLEIVEGMLNLGNASAAETLARKIIGEFTRAGLNKRAITALGYLQEALATSKASVALVANVREYIVSLRTSPERDFHPPRLTASWFPEP